MTNVLRRQSKQTALPFGSQNRTQLLMGALPTIHLTRGIGYTRSMVTVGSSDMNLQATPLHLMAGTRLDRVAVICQATTAGVQARLGIYEHDVVTNRPGALIKEFGTVPYTTGLQEITIDLTIHHTGIYWLAMLTEGGNLAVAGGYGGGLVAASVGSFAGLTWIRGGVTAGSLPDPFPIPTSSSNNIPGILLRVLETPSYTQEVDRIKALTRVYASPLGATSYKAMLGAKLTAAMQTKVMADGDLVLVPFAIQAPTEVKSMQANLTVLGGVGTKGDFCLYDSDARNWPARLLAKYEVAMDIQDPTTGTIDYQLAPGLYWVGFYNRTGGNVTTGAHEADGDLQMAISATNYPSSALRTSSGSVPDPFSGTAVDFRPIPRLSLIVSNRGAVGPHQTHLRRMYGPWASVAIPGAYIGANFIPYTVSTVKSLHGFGQARANPLIVDKPMNFDQVGISQSDTGEVYYELYLYDDVGRYPGRQLRHLAQVRTPPGGTGDQSAAINPPLHLDPGLYWLVSYTEANVNVHMMQGWSWLSGVAHFTGPSPYWGYLGTNNDPFPLVSTPQSDNIVMWLRVLDQGGV